MKVMIHEVLSKTAAYLQDRGWVQGGNGHIDNGTNTPACTLIAIGRVAIVMGIQDVARVQCIVAKKLADHLQLPVTTGGAAVAVANWNDDPDRTRNQVIAGIQGAVAVTKAQDASMEATTRDYTRFFDELIMADFAKAVSVSSIAFQNLAKVWVDGKTIYADVTKSEPLASDFIDLSLVQPIKAGKTYAQMMLGKTYAQKASQLAAGYGMGDKWSHPVKVNDWLTDKDIMKHTVTWPHPDAYKEKYAQTCTA